MFRWILFKGTTTLLPLGHNAIRPLLTADLPLKKNLLTTLDKSTLMLLGWTATMSAMDAAVLKNICGSGATVLIVSNEETEVIMKIAKSLE